MASSTNTNRGRSSFGVELEGYIAYVVEGTKGYPKPQPYPWPVTAGPLVIPKTMMANGVKWAVQTRLANLLRNSSQLVSTGATVVPENATADDLRTDELGHLTAYRHWTAKGDVSLDPVPVEVRGSWEGSGYGWVSFELCSPALWATDEGLGEVRRVCQFITDTLWVVATDRCGLHVHWGHGRDYIPFEPLRRVAGLLYAADRVLVGLHPPRRWDNRWCLSNSFFSAAARGHTAERVLGELALPEIPVNPTPPEREDVPCCPALPRFFRCLTGKPDDKAGSTPDALALSSSPNRYGFGRRGALGTYADDTGGRFNRSPAGVWDAVSELFRSRHEQVLAWLACHGRGAYNFQNYQPGSFGLAGAKRTIEFRQAAGSFDPDGVRAWARVCVRLCEWASAAAPERYWAVVYNCASVSDGTEDVYDVFDLLAEVGLLSEARTLQRIAHKRRGLNT